MLEIGTSGHPRTPEYFIRVDTMLPMTQERADKMIDSLRDGLHRYMRDKENAA